MKDRDNHKNWARMLNYFTFLQEISKGPGQTLLLLTKFDSLIVDLCDFILQEKSPQAQNETEKRISMGGSINPLQAGPLITICSHLIRCKYTPPMKELEDEDLPDSMVTFKDCRISEDITTDKKEQETKPEDKPRIRLSAKLEVTQDELDYFTCDDMMNLVFNYSYN